MRKPICKKRLINLRNRWIDRCSDLNYVLPSLWVWEEKKHLCHLVPALYHFIYSLRWDLWKSHNKRSDKGISLEVLPGCSWSIKWQACCHCGCVLLFWCSLLFTVLLIIYLDLSTNSSRFVLCSLYLFISCTSASITKNIWKISQDHFRQIQI